MTLDAGTKLGPYEVRGAAGAGGMGEVYRAHDSRLGRDVAIKVLPAHLSSNPDLRQRFEREARAVSSLNHPHICVLHDIGQQDGVDFIVMEYLEGETLAERLSKRTLAPEEVLRYGVQIADALDKAHKSGVVHRDLKPGNVMLTKSGAKLMDFGLARAAAPSDGTMSSSTQSPTMTQPLTAEGSIVGTFQYMSPEQLEGHEADTRSDIFALGATLYEMATGRHAFEGKSQASLIASIMKEEPRPISDVAPLSPPGLDRVVKQCMAKDPDERLQSAHDLRLQLQWVAEGGSQAGVATPVSAKRKTREMVAWTAAAVLAIATLALAIPRLIEAPAPTPAMRVTVIAPDHVLIDDEPLYTSISPGGQAIVFVASDTLGTNQLWLRFMNVPGPQPLPTTEGASLPFWSPDSRYVGFFADGKLKKIPINGTAAQTLCDAPDGRGGAWSPKGYIIFSPASASPIHQVAASGGDPAPVTVLDSTRSEAAHRFPTFLPDGRRFLYVVVSSNVLAETWLGSVDSDDARLIIEGDSGAIYAGPGYLLYSRNDALLAQPFDARSAKITGEPVSIGEVYMRWTSFNGATAVSASTNGVVAMRHSQPHRAGLEWLDRRGSPVGTVPAPTGEYGGMSLSPDGTRAALLRGSSENFWDVWVIGLDDGLATRVTFDALAPSTPVWSPDGEYLCFGAYTDEGTQDLFRRHASGAGETERLLNLDGPFNNATDWSRDGRNIIYRVLHPETGEDVWVLPMGNDRTPRPFLRTRYHEEDATLSPNGRWIAYCSDESGRMELYVQSFPEPRAKQRISKTGAGLGAHNAGKPLWRRDGRELFFLAGDGVTIMSVDVETGETFRASAPRARFTLPTDCRNAVPSPDGSRFLVLRNAQANDHPAIHVTLNWPALLKK